MKRIIVIVCILFFVSPLQAELLWEGDFEVGHFRQWHTWAGHADYWGTPQYGRPAKFPGDAVRTDWYGNGELLMLVTDKPALEVEGLVIAGPVRQGNYAARWTVKSSAGGGVEPDDCDPRGGGNCANRRVELSMHEELSDTYDAMPYLGENWLSASFYVPSDWDASGTGFGRHLFSSKARNESGSVGVFSIGLKSYGWELMIVNDPTQRTQPIVGLGSGSPYVYYYTSLRPDTSAWDVGARVDFPDVAVSQAALASVNKGVWTDWIIHAKWDERGPTDGGTGFLRFWKREDDGAWVQVLDIEPAIITRSGTAYERGVGYYVPATGTSNGGYGLLNGMYMEKEQVWSLVDNLVIFSDNIKLGDENMTFNEMRPEGADPEVPLSRVPGVRLSGGIGWR